MDKVKLKMKEFALRAWDFLKEKLQIFWMHFCRLWKKFHVTKVSILLFLIISLGLSVYLTIGARQVNVSNLRAGLERATTIVDVNGEEAGTLYAQKGTFVSIDEISPHVKDALIATEDQRFMSHRGFDLIGIGRAAVGYVIQGEIVGGGSTITQQLAKNAYLTLDQTLVRKLKELFIAIEIEKTYTKEEILEMYLNNSYFGQGVWGVHDASQKYFNKSASDLSLSEAATMIALLKAPSHYNPIDNYERAIQRRNVVLKLMADTGVITEEEKTTAQATDLALSDGYVRANNYRYPYYFDAVVREAKNKYGFEEQDIMNGGYTIYTNLNQEQQQQMDAVYANDSLFETASDGVKAQSASIAIHPKTGGITAVVGGRGEHTFLGLNRATMMKRQPGSIIKPLSVYAPALEAGYKITDTLIDDDITYGEGDVAYNPQNYDHQFAGEIPMYQALAESKNAATVWLLDQIGIRRGYNKLKEFGVSVVEEDYEYGAVALGGMTRGTNPLEMASAYSVFANDGIRVEPHFIRKIVDPTGAIVVDNTKPKQKRVLSPSVNDDMNRMLLNVFSNGLATSIQPNGYEVAGKTGTTQTSNNVGVTDQWVVAYTPDIVIASWQGFDETNETHYLTSSTLKGIGQVVKREFETILPHTQGTQFAVDDTDIEVIVRDNRQNETVERLKENLKKGGKLLRQTTEQAVDGAKEVMRDAKRVLDSFLNNR